MTRKAEWYSDESQKAFVVRLGKQVLTRRQSQGMSQQDLAEKSGLHRTYISGVERGARNMSVLTAYNLALALDTSLPVLLEQARAEE